MVVGRFYKISDTMKRSIFVLLMLLTLTSCVQEPNTEHNHTKHSTAKIINSQATPIDGRLLVCIAEGAEVPAFESICDVAIECKKVMPHATRSLATRLDRWYVLLFDASADVRAIAEMVAEMEEVEVVEYDTKVKHIVSDKCVKADGAPMVSRAIDYPFNDPYLPNQWHYMNYGNLAEGVCEEGADINLFNAWRYTTGDSRVIVAVIDGGVMTDHPDLADSMWVNEAEKSGVTGMDDDGNGYIDDIHGYNFVSDRGTIVPEQHGTHVAGTIAATNNNGIAGCGIAGGTGKDDGARIMSLQIFEGEGGASTYGVVQAFIYAADNGAVITNNSWGYDATEQTVMNNDALYEQYMGLLQDGIDYFTQNAGLEGVIDGGIAIFAAGNEAYHTSGYPAAYYDNISVAAMAPDYAGAYYTNYGPGVNLSAPGGNMVYSTLEGVLSTSVDTDGASILEYLHGTSMAAPHVSGCAALAISYALKQGYSLTAEELRTLILTSVHDIDIHQNGMRHSYSEATDWIEIDISRFKHKLGAGYIDSHMLLMQMDRTPCLYLKTGVEHTLSLDSFFGEASSSLTYHSGEVTDEVKERLGIEKIGLNNGQLIAKCTKPGVGRIKIAAIIGGSEEGGGENIGGMVIEREFELVVRGSKADNGGWL